jgi:hypothetical protein
VHICFAHTCVWQASTKDKWWTMNKILTENGFDPNSMKEKDRNELFTGILLDNRTQFGHEYKVEESVSKNPLLAKYFYIEDDGVKRAFETKDTIGMISTSDLKEQAVQSALSSGSLKLTIVKSENPMFEDFKSKLVLLTSAKNALDKLASQANDLYYQMKAGSDKGCQAKAPEVKTVLEKMQQHLEEARELVAEGKMVDASHNDFPKLIQSMTVMCEFVMAHQDGFKNLKKRCVAMLC